MSIETGEDIKASDFVGNPAPFLSIETTVGTTHSLTTIANQKCLITVTGDVFLSGATINATINLKYNSVIKASITGGRGSTGNACQHAFCAQTVITPAALF